MQLPQRYVPKQLTRKDRKRQIAMVLRSRKAYNNRMYKTRKRLPSFKNKTSSHILKEKQVYKTDKSGPSAELARKTGCSMNALRQIVRKGEGAYYSSGSRPNQTAHSWGLARLASSLTSGKAAAVDYNILEKGCDHNKRAFRLAQKARQKYGYGHGTTRKVAVQNR